MTRTLFVVTLALATACSSEPNGGTGPAPVADVDGFVASLGTWEAYAPPGADGESDTGPQITVDEVVGNATYQCTVTPRSLTSTPDKIVMYEPNASIMWVGNLLQGDSYKGGTGSFEELSIRQRAPLKVSIDLLTGDNFAIVDNPSLTTVQSAIGALIQKASDQGHLSGSSIDYSFRRMHATVSAMQKLGLSGTFTYSGVPIALTAEAGWEVNSSLKGVLAHFTQKMFTISIELPQAPGDLFSDALTPELLQAQVDAGNVGPNNLPVYIASITYGRTLTYTLVDAASELRLSSAVEASFKGIPNVASAGLFTENELQTTLNATRLRATAIGGQGQTVIDLIRTGQLSAYFTTDAPLTSARPISYQLNYLGNNSIAKVSETSTYELRECEAKPTSPERFAFLPLETDVAGVTAPFATLKGDFNGDGRGDIALNHLASAQNQSRIGFGNVDGTFTFAAAATHPNPPASWSDNYSARVGDFDGDGSDDLLWVRPKVGEALQVYVALSDGAGGFTFLAPEMFGASWADTWEAYVGDHDGDGDDDLYVNYRSTTSNFTVVATSDGDGTFTLGSRIDHPVGGKWANYRVFIGDVGGDGREDLVWNWPAPGATGNWLYGGRSNGDRTLAFLPSQEFLSGWDGYVAHMGSINSDGRSDMVWVKAVNPIAIHRALGQSSGSFSSFTQSAQSIPRDSTFFGPTNSEKVPTYVGDFTGDGQDDLLINRLISTRNSLMVGASNSAGEFTFAAVPQEHSAPEDWTQFDVLIMDVTGDGVDDVVWVQGTATMRIYVAKGL